jgi:hypothetical protein
MGDLYGQRAGGHQWCERFEGQESRCQQDWEVRALTCAQRVLKNWSGKLTMEQQWLVRHGLRARRPARLAIAWHK